MSARFGRVVRIARAAYGLTLISAPARVLRAYGGDPTDENTIAAARVLGGRHVLQAIVTGDHPGSIRRIGGAVVDALHAASMFAIAQSNPSERRRPALIDGSVAAAFAVAGVVATG